MKAKIFIKIQDNNNYRRARFKDYQQLIDKLIYLLYSIKLDISFVVGEFN